MVNRKGASSVIGSDLLSYFCLTVRLKRCLDAILVHNDGAPKLQIRALWSFCFGGPFGWCVSLLVR